MTVVVLYHPPGADDNFICEDLFNSLATTESTYPNCALIIAGDFNRLDITWLKRHFQLKQIMKTPTRKDAILDLVLTNLYDHYDKPQTFPPFGLSDHNTISVSALARKSGSAPDKFILKRDLRPSRKAEMGRFLCSLDWPLLFGSLESCDALLSVFEEVIHTGLDLLMPVSKVRLNTRGASWMTQHLKDLIKKRHRLSTKKVRIQFNSNFIGIRLTERESFVKQSFMSNIWRIRRRKTPKLGGER